MREPRASCVNNAPSSFLTSEEIGQKLRGRRPAEHCCTAERLYENNPKTSLNHGSRRLEFVHHPSSGAWPNLDADQRSHIHSVVFDCIVCRWDQTGGGIHLQP